MMDHLFVHRCIIKRVAQSSTDGIASYSWATVEQPTAIDDNDTVKCLIDLSYTRPGRDIQWRVESGRAPDRSGTAFFPPGVLLKPDDHIVSVSGFSGRFAIQGLPDELTRLIVNAPSHIEVSITEVAKQFSHGA